MLRSDSALNDGQRSGSPGGAAAASCPKLQDSAAKLAGGSNHIVVPASEVRDTAGVVEAPEVVRARERAARARSRAAALLDADSEDEAAVAVEEAPAVTDKATLPIAELDDKAAASAAAAAVADEGIPVAVVAAPEVLRARERAAKGRGNAAELVAQIRGQREAAAAAAVRRRVTEKRRAPPAFAAAAPLFPALPAPTLLAAARRAPPAKRRPPVTPQRSRPPQSEDPGSFMKQVAAAVRELEFASQAAAKRGRRGAGRG